MATGNQFDEKFEGTGYEETWSAGETLGAGSTLDADALSSDVSSPSGWGTQCLKIVTTGNDAYTEDVHGADVANSFIRAEFVFTAESLGNSQRVDILDILSDTGGGSVCKLSLYQDASGNLQLRARILIDTATRTNYFSSNLSLNTRYRFELNYNTTANTYEWRLDGATQNSSSLLGDAQTSPVNHWKLGAFGTINAAMTAYADLFGVDNAAWLGAEPDTINATAFETVPAFGTNTIEFSAVTIDVVAFEIVSAFGTITESEKLAPGGFQIMPNVAGEAYMQVNIAPFESPPAFSTTSAQESLSTIGFEIPIVFGYVMYVKSANPNAISLGTPIAL